MYQVWLRQGWTGAETLIHSSHANSLKLVSPSITLDMSVVDSFTFSIYPGNPGYEAMNALTTWIRVYDTHQQRNLFEGRVLQVEQEIDSDGGLFKTITCESFEAILKDTSPAFTEYNARTRLQILQSLISQHNSQVDTDKQVKLGNVSFPTTTLAYCYTDDSADTADNLSTLIMSGYEYKFRNENGVLYMDVAASLGGTGTQVIQTTKNVISATRDIDPTSVFSILKPVGATIQSNSNSTDTDKGTARLTISSVNNGSPYLVDQNLVNEFGRIVKAYAFDNDTTAAQLLKDGKAYLSAQSAAVMQFQATVVDLHIINGSYDDLRNGYTYPVKVPQMGIDDKWRIKQMTIDLMSPDSDTVTMGDRALGLEAYQSTYKSEISALKKSLAKVSAKADASVNFSAAQGASVTLTVGPGDSAQSFDYTVKVSSTLASPDNVTIETSTDGKTWSKSYAGLASTGSIKPDSYGTYSVRAQANFGGYGSSWSGSQTITLVSPVTHYGDANGAIIDVSEFQGTIDWSKVVAAGLSVAVIRVQSGSDHVDKTYQTNINGAIAAGANYAVYAYVNATSSADAKTEADNFYSRAQSAIGSQRQPVFWMLDVETNNVSSGTLKDAISAYMDELNTKGVPDSKIVIYVSEALYSSINVSRAGAIWIPAYGTDDGTVQADSEPSQAHDLWQYTSKGKISGITANTVDMSTHASAKMKALINN